MQTPVRVTAVIATILLLLQDSQIYNAALIYIMIVTMEIYCKQYLTYNCIFES